MVFLFLPCGFQGLKSRGQSWQQAPLSTEPCHLPINSTLNTHHNFFMYCYGLHVEGPSETCIAGHLSHKTLLFWESIEDNGNLGQAGFYGLSERALKGILPPAISWLSFFISWLVSHMGEDIEISILKTQLQNILEGTCRFQAKQ